MVIRNILIILLVQLLFIPQISFAQDTTLITGKAIKKPPVNQLNSTIRKDSLPASPIIKKKFSPDPLKATMLAVAFPGFGQIYNRKVWKIPLVYAGFGGLIYSVKYNSKNYNKFLTAYKDFTDTNPETASYLTIITADPSTYDPVRNPGTYSKTNEQYYKDGMLRNLDYFKRYRDLSYIGIAGWYLITILDANVDASLFNYDVSDNLDLSLFPTQVALPGGYFGAGINMGLTINF
jgi:hypothetical protein